MVGAVDRQGVLDQVIGANRQKIETSGEHAGGKRRRRHLDHAAHRHVWP